MTHRTPRSRAATAALLGLLLATGATGGALATPGTFSVTGHVSNATGDPLTCVVIAYVPGAGFFSAIADPVGGDYTLTGLQSGTQYAIREAGCVVAPDLSYIGQSWPALVTGAPSEVVSGVNFVLESSAPAAGR